MASDVYEISFKLFLEHTSIYSKLMNTFHVSVTILDTVGPVTVVLLSFIFYVYPCVPPFSYKLKGDPGSIFTKKTRL